ncbi:MAG: 16S rRNA (guanine(966)-N(2))-methyltransferase RsmD [Kangiellaceae bacterium]|nr:16S rRNA (guanine(966)-N(2))-methyltransferase RsmD [Kangiellaceae bacterium]
MANRNKLNSGKSASSKSAVKSHGKSGIFRVIGGQWKGRKLRFIEVEGLRPSLDRVRETLFNWLQWDIRGAKCLDLFAGSGALGIEALSRGAGEVQFIELNKKAANQLRSNLEQLQTDDARLFNGDALKFVETNQQAYDIIFIDPPFHKGIAQNVIDQLAQSATIQSETLIYIEVEQGLELDIPEHWQLLKDKKAGQLLYKLFQVT